MVEVATLGSFSLKVDGESVTDSARRTQKLWKLLNLLVAHRSKSIPIPTIIEFIWPDEEVEDYTKSLHNLIFRLRRILGGKDGAAKNRLVFSNNSYVLNTDEDFVIDAYDFEDCIRKAKQSACPPHEKKPLLERALSLYNGKYLMDSYDDVWALTLVNKYKRMYIDGVAALSDVYMEEKDYEKLTLICEKAIGLEPLEEVVYEKLIKCLIATGQKIQAIALCEELFDLLYREIGVGANDNINSMYKEIKDNVIQTQHNVVSALNELTEHDESDKDKAAVCNIDVFKSIYRYEVRQSARRGESVFLALLTINDKKQDIPATPVLNGARSCLLETCRLSLRRGDIVASYSNSQIVILLTKLAYEDSAMVFDRIRKKFAQVYSGEEVIIKFEIKPMLVEMMMDGK